MGIVPMNKIDAATTAEQTTKMELRAIRVFADLCALLDEYGPSWYSEEIHDRAQGALRLLEDLHGLSRIRPSLSNPTHATPLCRSFVRRGMA